MPTSTNRTSYRDSWPPTQIWLRPQESDKDEPRPLLEDIDDDPLNYFLTPTPGFEEGSLEDDGMDFDAGIEDASHSPEPVRSVSPSTLDGLRRRGWRPDSPDTDSEVSTPNGDDDNEDYIRPSANNTGFLSLPDFGFDGRGQRSRSPVLARPTHTLLSPASFPAPFPRGRLNARGRQGRTRSLSARSRPNHLWREPSPDVWSIEEETEEALLSDRSTAHAARRDVDGQKTQQGASATVEKKPVKRVRFLLPAGN